MVCRSEPSGALSNWEPGYRTALSGSRAVTDMSEEAGSIRITCSEGSSLGTRNSFVRLDSCCFFFMLLLDAPHPTDLFCAVTATLEATFTLSASGADLTFSVVPLLLIGWYLGMGNLRFF